MTLRLEGCSEPSHEPVGMVKGNHSLKEEGRSGWGRSWRRSMGGVMAVGVWDKQTKSKWRDFRGHTRSVKCVEWMTGTHTQFATGARGGQHGHGLGHQGQAWHRTGQCHQEGSQHGSGVKNKNEATCNPLPSPLPRVWWQPWPGWRAKPGTGVTPSRTMPSGGLTAWSRGWVDSNTLASCGTCGRTTLSIKEILCLI